MPGFDDTDNFVRNDMADHLLERGSYAIALGRLQYSIYVHTETDLSKGIIVFYLTTKAHPINPFELDLTFFAL